ncbi:unnamed protein product [Sphagnum jensenii]|uniref:Uncharacterized protein n=2 Tax=Sphagnum jensenii TaxID=128206 RepID=A0ABP0WUP2_9BRYO
MSDILDPLQIVEPQLPLEEFPAEKGATTPTSRSDQTTAILHWSVEDVRHWLEHNVALPHSRLQEVVKLFSGQGVDGLGLLTLQRNHEACLGMSNSEWLLVKAARRWLMAQGETPLPRPENALSIEHAPSATPPSTPQSTRSERSRDSHEKTSLLSPRKQWGMPNIWWGSAKDDQAEAIEREVLSLRGEIVGAEEREATMLAQLDHVDEVLRTAQLASYFHSRTRWSPLPGEPPVDDTDVDDWLLRFLVLRGSSICFYLRATDLRPQGTIMRSEIVEVGPIPNHLHHQDDSRWSAFHITTCHGLRLECTSLLKVQVDCWLSLLTGGFSYSDLFRLSPHPPLPLTAPGHKILQAQLSDSTMGQEGELFGEVE